MNKKDYELIAKVMSATYGSVTVRERSVLDSIVRRMAAEFKAADKKLDIARFIAACGVTS